MGNVLVHVIDRALMPANNQQRNIYEILNQSGLIDSQFLHFNWILCHCIWTVAKATQMLKVYQYSSVYDTWFGFRDLICKIYQKAVPCGAILLYFCWLLLFKQSSCFTFLKFASFSGWLPKSSICFYSIGISISLSGWIGCSTWHLMVKTRTNYWTATRGPICDYWALKSLFYEDWRWNRTRC